MKLDPTRHLRGTNFASKKIEISKFSNFHWLCFEDFFRKLFDLKKYFFRDLKFWKLIVVMKINIVLLRFFLWARYDCVLSKNGIYHSRFCSHTEKTRVAWKNIVFRQIRPTFTTAASYRQSRARHKSHYLRWPLSHRKMRNIQYYTSDLCYIQTNDPKTKLCE